MYFVPTPPKKLIVYVDGFNLYHGMHDAYGRSKHWLDLVALARSLRPLSTDVKVKYFTAPVLDEPDAESNQTTYIKALEALYPAELTIIQGRYQKKIIKCRKCGHERNQYEEKETDVNIAIHLVADALVSPTHDAMIISADSDLVPAIKAVQEYAPGLFMVAAFPPQRNSWQIRQLLPASFSINRAKLTQSQLPDLVTDPKTGFIYERPAKWTKSS